VAVGPMTNPNPINLNRMTNRSRATSSLSR
jgi:hypothetical protein